MENAVQKSTCPAQVVALSTQDLVQAGKVMRLAFGTFIGLADPMTFMGDTDYARTRYTADPSSAYAAKIDGELVGSVFVCNWGSVGFLGPLTVLPPYWDKGIAGKLMEQAIKTFDRWDTKLAGLFTFPHSAKHLGLFQKFGFWPRYLTSLCSKPVLPHSGKTEYILFSSLAPEKREKVLNDCSQLTDRIYGGMDLRREIHSVASQNLGDTVLIVDQDICAFAVCHARRGSEAVSGSCYVKFAAVRPGKEPAATFHHLLSAVEHFAFDNKAGTMTTGCNTGCEYALRHLLQFGFKREMQGVIMHRPNEEGFYRKDVFVLNDWR